MKKKVLSAILIAALVATLAACGGSTEATAAASSAAEEAAEEEAPEEEAAPAEEAAPEEEAAPAEEAGGADISGKTIGYYMDAADDYYKCAYEVFMDLVAANPETADWTVQDIVGQGTSQEQLSAVEDYITAGVDAIIVVQNSPGQTDRSRPARRGHTSGRCSPWGAAR